MATSNQAALAAFAKNIPSAVNDCLVANSGGTQAGATPLRGGINRFTLSAGDTYSAVLPTLIDNSEGSDIVLVVNDAGHSILVYCGLGDTMNTVANSYLTIVKAGFGIFIRKKRTDYAYVAPDWSAAAFT